MKRRDFLKCAAGVYAMAMCSYPDSLSAPGRCLKPPE